MMPRVLMMAVIPSQEFLDAQLEEHYRVEQEKMDESDKALKRMQMKLRDEELRILRGEDKIDDSNFDLAENSFNDEDGGSFDQEDMNGNGNSVNGIERPLGRKKVKRGGGIGARSIRRSSTVVTSTSAADERGVVGSLGGNNVSNAN